MPRDYATKPSAKGRPASRGKKSHRGFHTPGWAWAFAGLALGLFIAFLVYLNEHQPTAHGSAGKTSPKTTSQKERAANKASDRPRFDFYTILPELEVVLPELTAQEPRETESTDSQEAPAKYLLQAGSFRAPEPADSLRARLALLGVEANIEKVRLNAGETWYRVRVGPFDKLRELAKIQERLRRNEIQTLRLKIKG